jgi:hypothetical protein
MIKPVVYTSGFLFIYSCKFASSNLLTTFEEQTTRDMTATEIRSELITLQIQLRELTKLFKASNLTDSKVQGMLTKTLFRKKYLESIIL